MKFVNGASVMSAGLALVLFVLIGCEGRSGSEEAGGDAVELPAEGEDFESWTAHPEMSACV